MLNSLEDEAKHAGIQHAAEKRIFHGTSLLSQSAVLYCGTQRSVKNRENVKRDVESVLL